MLQPFLNTINKIAAFNFATAQSEAIKTNTDVLADMQADQFAQGHDSRGEPILLNGRGYNLFYADKKRKYGVGLGAVTSRVTLFYTGELYKQLFASIVSGNVQIKSRVSYFPSLMSRTGDVTGLDYEHRVQFANEYVLVFVDKMLQKETGLRIKRKTGVTL